MSNQEIPDFFDNSFDDLDKQELKKCEETYKIQLESRGLTWQRFENLQDKKGYLISFGTPEGIYITAEGNSIQECYEKAIDQYDQDMIDKKVPLNPISKQFSDKLTVFKGEGQIDESHSLPMIYKQIKKKLLHHSDKVEVEEAEFFLEYFKDHISEEDFELAATAQKILGI